MEFEDIFGKSREEMLDEIRAVTRDAIDEVAFDKKDDDDEDDEDDDDDDDKKDDKKDDDEDDEDDDDVKKKSLSEAKSGDDAAYEKFFNKALKKFNVKEPDELSGDKEKEFYDYIDKNWKSDSEMSEARVKTTTFDLPSHWAGALINGDYSGLDNSDERELRSFLRKNPDANGITADVKDLGFKTSNDANRLGGDVSRFTAIVR